MTSRNFTLSIQLIDDNGQPVIDEIISGDAIEVKKLGEEPTLGKE